MKKSKMKPILNALLNASESFADDSTTRPLDSTTRPPVDQRPKFDKATRYILELEAQRDELLEWKTEAIATSERQLVAFQEMQAVAQRKETEKRNLIAILKGINPLLPEDVQEKVESEIAKCEANK